MADTVQWQAPVHRFPFRYLVVVPVILAVATIATLFIHSDVNVALLWSQCHSHARIPGLSEITGLGTPLCYLVSFFQEAIDSVRSTAVVAVVLAFVGALLTINTIEAARACNAPNFLIAYPTGPWLIFNLIGGAVVWELVIIPAFLYRARRIFLVQKAHEDDNGNPEDSLISEDVSRHLPDSDVMAIPVSIAIGYYLPSILMLVYKSPEAVGVWLFFPVYVSLIRQIIRQIIVSISRTESWAVHLSTDWRYSAMVYTIPVLCSILAQIGVMWNMAQPDDRKELTRSTMAYIEIDAQFIAWTVLYWVLVEVGWRVPLVILVSSIFVGPGAGLSIGWIYREKLFADPLLIEQEEDDRPDEETPLLR